METDLEAQLVIAEQKSICYKQCLYFNMICVFITTIIVIIYLFVHI